LSKPLNIAITADPELPVPPLLYGGIERIIDMLIKGYTGKGHNVALFAHEDSVTGAKLYAYKGKSSRSKSDFIKNSWLINKTIFSEGFDIVHSFGRLAYLLPQLPFRIPKLMSYQREPTLAQIKTAIKLAYPGSLAFTGCSDYISKQINPYAPSFTVYNGVPFDTYTFKEYVKEDAPLVFLGRIEPIKGTHIAIEVAKETGRKLIIAGNIPGEYSDYFTNEIEPFLNDQIQYVGAVDDKKKNELLGKAAAFLMPIEWNEPFGIVMAEALACGTPVIGFNRGSVPEIVKHGINGFLCSTINEMADCVNRIQEIDRIEVRRDAGIRFSSEVIVDQYLKIYSHLLNRKENN
jgi:glycosyltransferase involved in cell wall biosynthesis